MISRFNGELRDYDIDELKRLNEEVDEFIKAFETATIITETDEEQVLLKQFINKLRVVAGAIESICVFKNSY